MAKYNDTQLEYASNTQTLIGSKKRVLIDQETGERIDVNQVTKRVYGSKNFWKVYLMDFLQVLGILDSKQVDVLIYILENTDPANNTFIGSQKSISEATNTCLQTVNRIMVKLQDANFLKQVMRGVYQISPTIMLKGNDYKQQLLINYYNDEKDEKKAQNEDLKEEHDEENGNPIKTPKNPKNEPSKIIHQMSIYDIN